VIQRIKDRTNRELNPWERCVAGGDNGRRIVPAREILGNIEEGADEAR
jgi:hypothetical protein